MMAATKYQLLDNMESLAEPLEQQSRSIKTKITQRPWKSQYAVCILLAFSMTWNIILLTQKQSLEFKLDSRSYLGLEKNITKVISHSSESIDDEMWDAPELDPFLGIVALSDEFVETKNLPSAQRFPWDKSKGVYVFHGYHSLHCVFLIRQALREFHYNQSQTWPFAHVTHCLNTLREDTTCNADDTPRYIGALHAQAGQNSSSSGIGQNRMCRDWNKLRQFAVENSACYRRPLDRQVSLLDRYKSCPDGSKPWEKQLGSSIKQ